MVKKYQTVLSELEETKTNLAKTKMQMKVGATNLAKAISSAKNAEASLVQEQQVHNREVNSWRRAAQDVLRKVRSKFQSADHAGGGKDGSNTLSTSLLDAAEQIQTPDMFVSKTMSLLEAADSCFHVRGG